MLPLHLRHRQAAREDEPAAPDTGAPTDAPGALPPIAAEARADRLFAQLALSQGAYFALTGVWALLSLGTFMRITGPKTDTWLVKTVGALVTVIGATLVLAGMRREPSDDVALLAAGSAAALACVDVAYVAKGRISPVYLLDAIAEAGLLAGWWAWMRAHREPRLAAASSAADIAL